MTGREHTDLLDDEALYTLAVDEGDAYAQHRFGTRMRPVILAAARQWIDTVSLAEEVCAEVMRKLMMPQSERVVTSVNALVFVATRNTAYSFLERRRRDRDRVQEVGEHYLYGRDHTPPPSAAELQDLEADTLHARLRQCIGQLKREQRTTLECFYFEDLSYADIAERLSLSPGKVRSHLQNGRKRLKHLMGEP